MTEIMKEALRDIAPGFVSFYIKAADTEKNVEVHDGFKAYARDECAGDYTKALEKLLLYYQEDAKFEAVWEYIKTLKIDLDELRIQLEDAKHKEVVEEDNGTF